MVEIIRTEVTPTHRPPKRTRFCSVDNSGEDATTTPVSSEVFERQSAGRLASPPLMQKREASAVPARTYHSTGKKNYVTFISLSERGETCFDTFTQTEVEYRHKKRTGDTCHKCKNTN